MWIRSNECRKRDIASKEMKWCWSRKTLANFGVPFGSRTKCSIAFDKCKPRRTVKTNTARSASKSVALKKQRNVKRRDLTRLMSSIPSKTKRPVKTARLAAKV